MKTTDPATDYGATYDRIISSAVFRTDGIPIDLCAELTTLANQIHADPEDIEWSRGEFTEAPLSELIVGAYWALVEWHGGQWSPEYAALCALGQVFKPGYSSKPDPDSPEWPSYVLISQALGCHTLFEPDSPEHGGSPPDRWWVSMPDAQPGFLLVWGSGDPVRIPCGSREEAGMIMGENQDLAGIWKPAPSKPAGPAPSKPAAFLNYLRTTLIPDLRESGMDATADDFAECCRVIDTLRNAAQDALDLLTDGDATEQDADRVTETLTQALK